MINRFPTSISDRTFEKREGRAIVTPVALRVESGLTCDSFFATEVSWSEIRLGIRAAGAVDANQLEEQRANL